MRGRAAIAVIQYQPTLRNDFDDSGGEWVEFSQCYADVRPLRGIELFNAQQVQSQVTHTIETEFIAGVTSAMRIKAARPALVNIGDPDHADNFRFFEIASVINPNEANRSLELLCIEKVK
jgi:SPP1 family predicted phage head-tail adaptor